MLSVYAIIVEINIITMFAAALSPRIMATLMFIAVILLYVRLVPGSGPKAQPVGRHDLIGATVAMLPVVVIFGVVIGGIYSPTAAAAISVVMVVAYVVAHHRLGLQDMVEAMLETAHNSGMILLVVFGAELLKICMSRAGVPQAAADLLENSGLALMTIMVLIIVTFLVLGCLMGSLSMVILAIPFCWPVVAGLDYGLTPDETKLWFGITILVVVELGLIMPPVGLNVFIINSVARDVPMRVTFLGVMPFFASEIMRITLLVPFPAIALFLPRILQ